MKLSRDIPSHKKTVEFNWCKKDFMEMSDKYREIRSRFKKPMDACFWCGHEFKNGEIMALAQPKKGLNKVLCQKCVDELK